MVILFPRLVWRIVFFRKLVCIREFTNKNAAGLQQEESCCGPRRQALLALIFGAGMPDGTAPQLSNCLPVWGWRIKQGSNLRAPA
jgi:hypothetical protein